jgi:hypothetical protein
VGCETLFYGRGDGTWPGGKPGFICHLDIETTAGDRVTVVSDGSWSCAIDRAHPPGQHKRWFLRALQEVVDSRDHPSGWSTPAFSPGDDWLPAMELDCPADAPPSCSAYETDDGFDGTDPEESNLRARSVPLVRERTASFELAEQGVVDWHRDPRDWFQNRVPDAFETRRTDVATATDDGWTVTVPEGDAGAVLTFRLPEQMVGWPAVVVDAHSGTTVELLAQESHDPDGPLWLDTHHFSWSRLVCDDGPTAFEPFEFESLRWLQLHVRDTAGDVTVRDVAFRRRLPPTPDDPGVDCGDERLQRVFDATANTIRNSVQERPVDGMGRERQQYSGDGGHQLRPLRACFGDEAIAERYLRTFSEGLTTGGFFLDCWPGYDRLARLGAVEMDATEWGPLLDHGIGFIEDCWYHYRETGDRSALTAPYPRLVEFAEYIASLRTADGLLPVDGLGAPSVWLDHDAFARQRHKQCAFTLYAAGVFETALVPLLRLFDDDRAGRFERLADDMVAAAVETFWDPERGLFVSNRPWVGTERGPRLDDRSLAMSVRYDQCPGDETEPAVEALADPPDELGLSYPANAVWRYWALIDGGRTGVVLDELRTEWASMRSVRHNNTVQESWTADPDTADQWSHCAVAPLVAVIDGLVGLTPVEPGYETFALRPRLADIPDLSCSLATPHGPIAFDAERDGGEHAVSLTVPDGCDGWLALPERYDTGLERIDGDDARYRLPSGDQTFRIPALT